MQNEQQQSDGSKHSGRNQPPPSDVSRASSFPRSIMSRLHHDDVSFTEAVDKYRAVSQYRGDGPSADESDFLLRKHACWGPKAILAALDGLVRISDFDDEMASLVGTSLPSSFQGSWTGFFNLLDVSLIGQMLGTEEASVFVVVNLLTWLPNTFNYGFCEALAKLVPVALERDDPKLAGAYLNASLSMYTLGMTLVGLMWSLLTHRAFIWFGFDEEAATLAQQYAYVQIISEWVSGIGYTVHLFLDVTGQHRYSTFANMTFGVGQTLGIVLPALMGQRHLFRVGLWRTFFAAFHVLGSSLIVVNLGWVNNVSNGLWSIPLTVRARLPHAINFLP
jgi:MatE